MKNENERLFHWSEESISWYKIAAENEIYHKQLAEHILRYLPENPNICDMGCGVGYLSLALAPYARSILSVDLNEKAINVLIDNVKWQKLDNICTVLGDFELLPPPDQPFDAIIMCLFGGLKDFLIKAEKWTSDKIIYIISVKKKHAFCATQEKTKGDTTDELVRLLNDNHYKFDLERITLPFGQPLKNYEEAVSFIRHYDNKSTDNEIDIYLKQNLTSFNNPEYPLYLPNEKQLAMFIIKKN